MRQEDSRNLRYFDLADIVLNLINYPAASSGVYGSISHSGLDLESSVSFLDSRFRGNDEKRGKPRGMYSKGFKDSA